jgi:hypothetical protein
MFCKAADRIKKDVHEVVGLFDPGLEGVHLAHDGGAEGLRIRQGSDRTSAELLDQRQALLSRGVNGAEQVVECGAHILGALRNSRLHQVEAGEHALRVDLGLDAGDVGDGLLQFAGLLDTHHGQGGERGADGGDRRGDRDPYADNALLDPGQHVTEGAGGLLDAEQGGASGGGRARERVLANDIDEDPEPLLHESARSDYRSGRPKRRL